MFTNHVTQELFLKVAYLGERSSQSHDAYLTLCSQTENAEVRSTLERSPLESGASLCLFMLGLGDIRGLHLRVHAYSLDAENPSPSDLRILLRGVDAVVLTTSMQDPLAVASAHLGSLRDLVGNDTPIVVQVRGAQGADLSGLAEALGIPVDLVFPLTTGNDGVMAAFRAAAKQALLLAANPTTTYSTRPVDEQAPGERLVTVGSYKLLLSSFWQFEVLSAPPVFMFKGTVPQNHLYLETAFREGSTEDAADLLRRSAESFQPRKRVETTQLVAGIGFTAWSLSDLAVPGLVGTTVEIFAGRAGRDVIMFSVGFFEADQVEPKSAAAMRRLCVSMVEGALIRRMNSSESPWK